MQIFLFLFSVCAGVDILKQTRIRLREGLNQCSAADATFSPLANAKYEIAKSGLYKCGDYLDSGSASLLYEASRYNSFTKYVIKYVSGKPGKTHQILHEYPFLYALNETGIAPRVFDVSNLVPIEDSHSIFKRVSNATMGYIVMERVGETLTSIIIGDDAITVRQLWKYVFNLGIATTKLLKKLHSFGICHGDIHGDNIAFKDASRTEVVLLDFGNSVFMPDQKDPVSLDENLNPRILSLWQLEGESPLAMRDDMFRLLETLVNFLMLGGLRKGFDHALSNLAHLSVSPRTRNMDKMEVAMLIAVKRHMRIRALRQTIFPELFVMLNEKLLPLVMNLSSPEDVPDYDKFVHVLENALEMIRHQFES